MKNRGLIAIIDDESVRESLPDLLSVLGHEATAYASAEDYLASGLLKPFTRWQLIDALATALESRQQS